MAIEVVGVFHGDFLIDDGVDHLAKYSAEVLNKFDKDQEAIFVELVDEEPLTQLSSDDFIGEEDFYEDLIRTFPDIPYLSIDGIDSRGNGALTMSSPETANSLVANFMEELVNGRNPAMTLGPVFIETSIWYAEDYQKRREKRMAEQIGGFVTGQGMEKGLVVVGAVHAPEVVRKLDTADIDVWMHLAIPGWLTPIFQGIEATRPKNAFKVNYKAYLAAQTVMSLALMSAQEDNSELRQELAALPSIDNETASYLFDRILWLTEIHSDLSGDEILRRSIAYLVN